MKNYHNRYYVHLTNKKDLMFLHFERSYTLIMDSHISSTHNDLNQKVNLFSYTEYLIKEKPSEYINQNIITYIRDLIYFNITKRMP